MVRKTALVTAMLGAFASQAFAMGLGDIRLNSVLNQPLHAEIELLSPTANDLAELQVALASGEAYAKAGVERVFFHTRLRFSIVKRPDGTAAIKVTSQEPVREPYLDFLIEATWGSGQVLREYTVLVDPPALMPAPRPTVAAPATSMPRASAPASVPAQMAGGIVDGEYHTRPSDTLWSIANAMRPDSSVSTEQAMLGLLKTNPGAFINGNINNLKAGQILRVPSREEMTALSHSAALDEVRRQNREWRDGRSVAAAPPPAPAAAEPVAPSAAEQASAAATPPTDAQAETDAQLKLLAPQTEAGKTAAAAGAGDGDLRQELTLAVEAVEAQRLENQELNTRLKQLEDQIAQLHRLIELKNTEMAQLGTTATPDTAAPAPAQGASEQADANAVPTDSGDTAAESGTGDTGLPADQAPVMDEQPVADAESAAADAGADESAATDAAEPGPAEAPATVAESAPQPQPEPVTAPAQEPAGGIAALLSNPLATWGAAGIAALVALLAWIGARRRRMQDTDFQESILADRNRKPAAAGPAVAAAPAAAAAAPAARSSEPKTEAPARDAVQSDSSLFTDFAVSDMGAMQNDAEADPVAEADVYLAYGRYQQAEELIRTALDRTPQRNDLKFKLLEVLYAAKNTSAFDAEAERLLASLGSADDELWQRTKEMGQELNPGNPLYRSGAAAPAVTASAAAAADHGLDAALGGGDSALDFTASAPAPADDNSLDFDVSELASFTLGKDAAAAPSIPADEDFSFDLGSDADHEGDGVLASSDEVATKLDLARAYIEMGDPEGARSILDEVLHEGNTAQKSEAQSLLTQMA